MLIGNGFGVFLVNRGGWFKCVRVNNKICMICKC